MLIGEQNINKITSSFVAIIGLGGVGGAVTEAIARSGVGKILICDSDVFDITNLNRQLLATTKTIGQRKTDVAKQRILDINPLCEVVVFDCFLNKDNLEQIINLKPDFIIDCIDTVTTKLDLAVACMQNKIKLISCMGTGNRIDPAHFKIGDISQTKGSGCPLSRVFRHELKSRGILKQKVLYSTLPPMKVEATNHNGRYPPASSAFCPPVAGFMLASEVVREICGLL